MRTFYLVQYLIEQKKITMYSIVKDKAKIPVYKVDISKGENASCVSDTSNPNAKNASELKINDITLIRITNGKIAKYISGSEKIEAQFK